VTQTKIRRPFVSDAFFEKEEAWLNEMAAQGLNLVKPGTLRSTFETGEPGEWVYRIQLLPKDAKKPESREYLDFVASSRVEVVSARGQVAYLRKRASAGPFELFSDRESRIAYLRRMRSWWAWECVFFVILMVVPITSLLPAGDVTAMYVLDSVLLATLLIAVIVAAGVNVARLLKIAGQIRSLEAERALQE
jgi:hypothetical protein